jgi:hypothetical protein
MKFSGIFRGMVMCLAALGVCLSGAVFAAPPATKPVVHDVALVSGGSLAGQLVDAQGVAKAGVDVTLLLEQRPLGTSNTDAQGRFAFQGVRGGVYQLTAAGGTASYRLWAPGTAPKGTTTMALMTTGDAVVRGQAYANGHYYQYQHSHSHLGRAKFLLSNPWVVSGIVATAVAVPVGIHNAGSGDTPASP